MAAASEAWSPARRLASRLVFAYLVLYTSPFDMSDSGDGGLWKGPVLWTGRLVGLDITVLPNGSGDTTFNYVQILCLAVVSLMAATLWSVFDRRGRWDSALFAALRVWIRYVLAYTLLSYGFIKVWKSQFPAPSPGTLVGRIGDASPMHLLWTFMGFSTAYTMFAGAGEVLGGLLLLWRRTTLAGALVTAAVMANVVMMNFSYDVPVKLYSLHLLLLALFLAAPDARRLYDFFVRNRPTQPTPEAPPHGLWLPRARLALKTLAVGFVVISSMRSGIESWKNYGDAAPKPPLYGVWEVEEFTRDGASLAPLLTDKTRWRRLVVSGSSFASLHAMDETPRYFRLKVDEAARTLALIKPRGTLGEFRWESGAEGALHLVGTFEGASVDVRLRRRDESSFLLVSRGFHWVNEYPYNN